MRVSVIRDDPGYHASAATNAATGRRGRWTVYLDGVEAQGRVVTADEELGLVRVLRDAADRMPYNSADTEVTEDLYGRVAIVATDQRP